MILSSPKFRELMFGEIAELFIRIDLLDKYENVIKSIETKAVEGAIDVDKNRDVRRTFTLKLDNENNEFTWSVGGVIWLDKRIRLFVSFDQLEWVSIGVFILDNPSADSKHTGEHYAELSGGDKWKLLDGDPIGKFTNVLTIP